MTFSGDFPPTLILGATSAGKPERPIEPERLAFTGSGGEYFRIWIVNLLLTMLTFGIYSAWAKVRRMRYFYDSTHLAGSSFEYHGNPVAILKGRIIAVVLIVAYNAAPKISVVAWVVMMVVMATVMPWLIWKSLQFKLYNSSYRGIRFGFGGTAAQAYKVYLWLPILSMFTLNFLIPFVHQRIKKFQHEESRFGRSRFSFHGKVGGFYGAYFVALIIFIVGMIWIMPTLKLLAQIVQTASGGFGKSGAGMVVVFFVLFAIFAWGHLVYSVFMTMLQNLIWNNTKLEDHQFKSDMAWTRVVFISLTNVLGIVLTLGLFTPFAKIRMLKYRIESTTLIPSDNLDDFVADTDANVSATGEAVTDLLDFDFAL